MPDATLQRRSALGGRPGEAQAPLIRRADLLVAEEPFLRICSLRISRRQQDVAESAIRSLGLTPPDGPNRFSGDERSACAWIEPRAWLMLGSDLAIQPRAAQQDGATMLTDVSDRYAAFRVSGPRAFDLLAAGTSVVASPQTLRAGRCARTRFAEEAELFVQQLTDAPDYRLLIDAGLARYMSAWLRDADRPVSAIPPRAV